MSIIPGMAQNSLKSWALGCVAGAFALAASAVGGEEALAAPKSVAKPKISQSFQWTSIWTRNPVKGAPKDSIYHTDRLQRIKKRLETYGGEDGEKAAREACLPLPEAVSVLEDPANALTFFKLTGTQRLLMSLLSHVAATPLGGQFVKAAAYHDVLLCAAHDNPSRSGFYDPTEMLIAVQTRNRCHGYDYTPAPGEALKETEAAYGDLAHTLAEEISHTAQHVLLENFLPKNVQNRWAADYKLWDLAIEAQAKLFAAWILLEMADEENGTNGYPLYWKQQDGTVEGRITGLVKEIVGAHGKEEIQARPELLLPAFLRFFESKSSMDFYISQNLEGVNSLKSLKRVSNREFAEAFSPIPDSEGSLFGRRQGLVSGGGVREGLVEAVAPGAMRDWFETQKVARKKGRAGPSLTVPESSEPSCVPGVLRGMLQNP